MTGPDETTDPLFGEWCETHQEEMQDHCCDETEPEEIDDSDRAGDAYR